MSPRFDHSDTGNAELMAHCYGRNLRYDPVTDRWLEWRDLHRWYPLEEAEVRQYAIRTANRRLERAVDMDKEDAKREAAFGIASRNLQKIQSMITIAKGLTPIWDNTIQWDASPNLLAVENGVVDLSTGILRAGRKEDYLSNGILIPYNPYAEAPTWHKFLEGISAGDAEWASFMLRAMGYTLTGHIREQVFFLLYGNGQNGKSVFCNILGELLRGFSQTIRFAAFEENAYGDAKRDLAELPGIRAIFGSETTEIKAFDTATIKQITGGEVIRTSRKYGHPFSYKPQFKLWLTANHKPRVNDDSFGFWRRVLLIPFLAKFEGAAKDDQMEDKLKAELPGILAQVVAGAIDWYQHKLQIPDSILLKTNEYRQDEDELENFLSERCHREGSVGSGALYEAYKSWTAEEGRKPIGPVDFSKKMQERYTRKVTATGKIFEGIMLRLEIKI